MKLASIDVGLKRIGVAICLDGKIALPQTAILRKNRKQAARDVNTFLQVICKQFLFRLDNTVLCLGFKPH